MIKFNKIQSYTFSILAGSLLLLQACRKDRPLVIDPQPVSTKGVYVLCEGAYSTVTNRSNSSITYFDFGTSDPNKDYFKTQNGIDLGSNANDLKQYGSKMYCVITGTTPANKDSYLEVMNIATGKSIKRIAFSDATVGFLPRTIAFYKGKAYVSSYDGYISKVDTGSLSIESRIKVGGALEGIAIVNNKLYVSNSDHYLYATANNASVSVVDLGTFTKVKDIAVGHNPTKIAATNAGDLFVITKGNYADILPGLDKLSSVTDTKVGTNNKVSLEYLNISDGLGFVIGDYMDPYFKTLNISNGEVLTNFVTDQTALTSPYGATLNTLDKLLYLSDSKNFSGDGRVFGFSLDGKKKFEFATGVGPQSVVFNYSYK